MVLRGAKTRAGATNKDKRQTKHGKATGFCRGGGSKQSTPRNDVLQVKLTLLCYYPLTRHKYIYLLKTKLLFLLDKVQ